MEFLSDYNLVKLIIATVSAVANAIALFILIFRKKKELTIYSMTKISLVSADLVYSILMVVRVAMETSVYAIVDDDDVISILGLLESTMILISFANISLIAVERYHAIKQSFKYSRITKRRQLYYI